MRILILFSLLLFSSCSIEKSTIRKTLKHREKLLETAGQLILEYQHQKKEIFLGVNDRLDKRLGRFIDKKLDLPWVHIIYDHGSHFIETDSVVLFTRTGIPIFGYQHNILVDYRKIARDSITGCGSCEKIKKIGDRLFYLKAPMPAF